MTAPRIGFVEASQHEALIDLLHEMNAHYNDGTPAVPRDVVARHLRENLLGPHSALRLIAVSTEGSALAGFAAITLFHSLVDPDPQRCGQLFLKELYVGSAHRGAGVGRALMSWIAAHAIGQRCARIDWTVEASNESARSFYRSLGAVHRDERLHFRLAGAALARAATT